MSTLHLNTTNAPERSAPWPRLEPLEVRRLLSLATMVKEIAPGSYPSGLDTLTPAGALIFGTARDPVHWWEESLWRSDGTAEGTFRLKMFPTFLPDPFATMNGKVYFMADDGEHGYELWTSDGTEAGTRMLKDIIPGATGQSAYAGGVTLGDRILFSAASAEGDVELWTTDGTETGTVRVRDIYPGAEGSYPYPFVNVNGVALFGADDGVHGLELWRSDGTDAGTRMVKDISAGASHTDAHVIVSAGGRAYFSFEVPGEPARFELWVSDGTEAGTLQLLGGEQSYDTLTPVGDRLFFQTLDDGVLWVTDGTPQGTVPVKQFEVGDWYPTLTNLTDVGGELFFSPINSDVNDQLWKSDGTEAGTVLVKDLMSPLIYEELSAFYALNGTLFFCGGDGVHGLELWKSDGTAAGTCMVQDIFPGRLNSSPHGFVTAQGTTFFLANDGIHNFELWKLPAYPFAFNNTFNFRTTVSMSLMFFDDVSASLSAGDLVVVNTDTNETIDPAAMAVSFDAATKTATFTFPGLPNGMLPDGNYRATLPADAVTDPSGNPLAQDEVLDFWYLAADPNRDGTVNLRDFNILAANFGLPGRDFTQGDFNYDGLVDMEDFNLLAARFGTALPGGALTTTVAGARAPAVTRIIDQIEEPDTRDDTLVVTGA